MPSSKNTIVSIKRPDHAAADGEDYWTEERRRSARPFPMPEAPKRPGKAGEAPKPRGEPGDTPHGHGTEKDVKPSLAPRGTGGQPVPTPLNYPYRTVGKLFGVSNGGGYAGSASLISPNVLLTAGHCVFNGGAWSTNISFYPSYLQRQPSDPMYKFNYSYIACWTAWSQNSNRAYDYGMVWIDAAPGNQLGWLGTLWNASTANRTWDGVGYPAQPNPPFNGNTMDQAFGQYGASSTPGTFMLTNDNMSHGSSGGPWITVWNESNPTHANGLHSFVDGSGNLYGPYFTQDVNNLFNWISNPANRR